MKWKAILGVPCLLATALLALSVAPAHAAPEKPLAKVAILPPAHLAYGGVSVKLRITCDPVPGILWEGVLNAEQGDIFGDAGLALDPSICDGRNHVENVGVTPNDSRLSFGRGPVALSVYVYNENDLTLYATDTRTANLR